MSIDTKSDLDQIQHLRHSPSMVPFDEDVPSQATGEIARPAVVVLSRPAPFRFGSASRRKPAGALATAGVVLGMGLYLAAIMVIAACALCWLPFCQDDPVAA